MGSVLSTCNSDRAYKLLLYVGGPFFCYPFKPLINELAGSNYKRAYKHFRRDHHGAANIALHWVALCFQLSSNYAMLAELDEAIFSQFKGDAKAAPESRTWAEGQAEADDSLVGQLLAAGPLSICTTGLWSAHLALRCHGAPLVVRAASVTTLWLAFLLRHKLRAAAGGPWGGLTLPTAGLEALGYSYLFLDGASAGAGASAAQRVVAFVAVLVLRLRLHKALAAASQPGSAWYSDTTRRAVTVLYLLHLARMSSDPFGKARSGGAFFESSVAWPLPIVRPDANPFVFGTFFGWLPALLTRQRWMAYHSMAFLASILQGVAHKYTKERATLPQLALATDELAHTTFFPTLLLHTTHQSLMDSTARVTPLFSS